MVVAREDQVGAQVLIQRRILRFVREHDDGLAVIKRRISDEGIQRGVTDPGQDITAHIDIGVVHEDDAQRLHFLV